MKVLFLLYKSPEHQDVWTVKRLAEGLIKAGHEVYIFLMEDGVYNAVVNSSPGSLSSGFDRLVSAGVEITLCTYTAEARGLVHSDFIEGVRMGSQYDLSKMVRESDRVLSFI